MDNIDGDGTLLFYCYFYLNWVLLNICINLLLEETQQFFIGLNQVTPLLKLSNS